MSCEICNGKLEALYEGKVRHGKPGVLTADEKKVVKCTVCEVAYLENYSIDYESDDYRNLVNDSSSEEQYYRLHDNEQVAKLEVLKVEDIRGRVIADVGTGAGSFLDLVSGFAKESIAIEPTEAYKSVLQEKGYKHFSYGGDALKEYEGQVDIVTSFAVIEHVEEAENFLNEIYKLLKPGGRAIISTPNADDFLLGFIGKDYEEFYYRSVHKWYFNRTSLENLASRVGFKKSSHQYKQRFDVSNLIHWLRDRKPTGLKRISTFEKLDRSFQAIMEENGNSDYLYMIFEK